MSSSGGAGRISPAPPLAEGVGLAWDVPSPDPVGSLASARARYGDTLWVRSGTSDYLFVFDQLGLANFYGLAEDTASKGVADYLMLRRKLPPEIFDGRRVLPSALFRRDDVKAYLANLDFALTHSIATLADGVEFEVFDFSRRLAHQMGIASWLTPELATGPTLNALIEAFDALDGAESFVHPDRMAAVAASEYASERAALNTITQIVDQWISSDRAPSNQDDSLLARVIAAWADAPAADRAQGVAYDVALIHVASMSNLAAALGWVLVDVLERKIDTTQDPEGLRSVVLESLRWSQRSLMARTVLKPCVITTESGAYDVKPGVTVATLLPLTNTDAERGLDQWRPDWWSRHKFAGPTPASLDYGVTAFGHGKHSCPAQPFALSAMTLAAQRLLSTWDLVPLWQQRPTPIPAQIGGVARAEQPARVLPRARRSPALIVSRNGDPAHP